MRERLLSRIDESAQLDSLRERRINYDPARAPLDGVPDGHWHVDSGEVVVGPATFAATRAAIRYEELGPQGLRGREEPVETYKAIDAPAPPGRRRAREQAPLLGRDSEVATLEQVVAMAIRRQRAQLVLLSGDAGVGKSRLASELGVQSQTTWGAFHVSEMDMVLGAGEVVWDGLDRH